MLSLRDLDLAEFRYNRQSFYSDSTLKEQIYPLFREAVWIVLNISSKNGYASVHASFLSPG